MLLRIVTSGVLFGSLSLATLTHAFAQLTDQDRREIVGLVAEFEQAVENQDRNAIENTLSPDMPPSQKQRIVDEILKASKNWNVDYNVEVKPAQIRDDLQGRASANVPQRIHATRGMSRINSTNNCRFDFKKVQFQKGEGPQSETGQIVWRISDTTAHETFRTKNQIAQVSDNVAKSAKGVMVVMLGVCIAVTLVLALVVGVVVWLIIRSGRPKESPLPPHA